MSITSGVKHLILFALIFVLNTGLEAQNRRPEASKSGTQRQSPGRIRGKVYDKEQNRAIEYATIALFLQKDSSVVSGVTTDKNGNFELSNLRPEKYYLEVSFLGYSPTYINDITVAPGAWDKNLDKITIVPDDIILDGVVVSPDQQSVSYQIDKKVIRVGENLSSAGMTAVEVLENVPSVRVNIDGEVSLRGSTGFTVLVDGKPTVLDPSDVLRQMPASTIQSIEIVTNPSVKYEPDGTAGLLNIITKKSKMQGLQGLINLKGGNLGQYGGDFLLNYKLPNINFYLGANYDYSPRPMDSYSERRNYSGDSITYRTSTGTGSRNRNRYGIKGGLEWDFSSKTNFSLESRGGKFIMEDENNFLYRTSHSFDTYNLLQTNNNTGNREMNYLVVNSNIIHRFQPQGHELTLQASYRYRDGQENSLNELLTSSKEIQQGTHTTEQGPAKSWNIKLDYVKKFNSFFHIETGVQTRLGDSKDMTTIALYDTSSLTYQEQIAFSNTSSYIRNIYAAYGIVKGEYSRLGYQLGLRGEYTLRKINTEKQNQEFVVDRYDLFPSLHFSYQLPHEQQIMTSYSRRIDRPRGHYFEPFITWMNMFNVRQGNPELLPEYIDATELGYLKSWENSQLSIEGFYRIRSNRIERIQSVYTPDVLLTSYENVGKDYALGGEFMYTYNPTTWWELTLMADYYNFKIKGELNGKSLERSTFNWSSRVNNAFKITRNLRLQLDGFYNSPSISSQGEESGYYALNAGARASFLEGKLTLVTQVRDLLGTVKHSSTTKDKSFYNYVERIPQSPNLSFTLSYSLNNYKKKRSKDSSGEDMDDDF